MSLDAFEGVPELDPLLGIANEIAERAGTYEADGAYQRAAAEMVAEARAVVERPAMSDLVERLREWAFGPGVTPTTSECEELDELLDEAADRITELEAGLEQVPKTIDGKPFYVGMVCYDGNLDAYKVAWYAHHEPNPPCDELVVHAYCRPAHKSEWTEYDHKILPEKMYSSIEAAEKARAEQ